MAAPAVRRALRRPVLIARGGSRSGPARSCCSGAGVARVPVDGVLLYLRLRCWWGGRAAVAAPRARPEGARRPGGSSRPRPQPPAHPRPPSRIRSPFPPRPPSRIRPPHRLSDPHRPGHPTPPTRRLLLARTVVSRRPVAAAGVVRERARTCCGGRSVQRVTVPLATSACGPRVPGSRVSSTSHIGPVLGREFAERVVGTINATRSLDLIAVVGDSGRRERGEPRPAVAPLARLRARGTARSSSPAATCTSRVRSRGWSDVRGSACGLPLLENARVKRWAPSTWPGSM